MSGTIRTYQKCPKCGAAYPSSKGGFPITCKNGCQTMPTKFYISIKWHGKAEKILRDRDGRTIHDWGHALALIGEIRGRMASHKTGKGFFDPGVYKQQSKTAFSAFWNMFLKKYKGATHDKIDAIGKHHMTYFADKQMRDIVPWNIEEWWQELGEKGLSDRYLADILTWARSFFKYAYKLEIIERVPPTLLDISVKIPQPEVEDWFTVEMQLAILNAVPEYDRPIFDFLFLTGCRVNEACALRRQDIRVDISKVIIQNTVKRDKSIGVVKNKKPRMIPYAGEIKDCITAALQRTGIGNEYTFVNKWGRRYHADHLRDTFYVACDKLGIRRIKLKNATRHSFGMGLLRKGYDIWQVSKIMNHSDTKVTEHYVKMVGNEIDMAYSRSENATKNAINMVRRIK